MIKLTVTYRGAQHVLSVLPDSTISALQAHLEELTSVPPSLQKLLYKGKKATSTSQDEDTTVNEAGLKDGMKIQLLGATMQELGGMKDAENAQRKREKILKERASKPQAKVSLIIIPSSIAVWRIFHRYDPQGLLQVKPIPTIVSISWFHYLISPIHQAPLHSLPSYPKTPPSGMSCRNISFLLVFWGNSHRTNIHWESIPMQDRV